MNKINWKVRFSKDNIMFIVRFVGALLVPILAYFGLKFEDITSFNALLDVLGRAVTNPYVLGLTLINALNMIPDPTTKGITDSEKALQYTEPKK